MRTKIYKRSTTEGVIVISKTTNNYAMVMTLTPKQWEALKNAKKPIVQLTGGDMSDPEMEVRELTEKEKKTLDEVRKGCDFLGD